PLLDRVAFPVILRPDTEPMDARLRELIRIVRVIVIQEGEERPLRLPTPGQPVEKLAIDHRRVFSIDLEERPEVLQGGLQEIEIQPILQEPLDRLEPIDGAIDQDGRLESGQPWEDVVVVSGETP